MAPFTTCEGRETGDPPPIGKDIASCAKAAPKAPTNDGAIVAGKPLQAAFPAAIGGSGLADILVAGFGVLTGNSCGLFVHCC
jgi:hypothetical protein